MLGRFRSATRLIAVFIHLHSKTHAIIHLHKYFKWIAQCQIAQPNSDESQRTSAKMR